MSTNARKLIAATVALIALVAALAGCTTPPLPQPTPKATPHPPEITEVVPTEAPLPATATPTQPPPTPTPPPKPTVVETVTYSRKEWGLGFQYPSAWQILEESEEQTVLVSDESLTVFTVVLALEEMDLAPALLRGVLEEIAIPGEEYALGETEWRSIGGYDAEVTRVTAEVEGLEMSGPITLVSDPRSGNFFVLLAWTPKPQVDEQQPIFDAIFDSVEFFPPRTVLEQPSEGSTSLQGQLAIVNESHFASAGGVLTFVGEVKNDAGMAAEDVYVRVQLFDGDGALLTDEEWAVPVYLVPAGDLAPFQVLFLNPPADWSSYKIAARGERAQFMLDYAYSDLEVVDHANEDPGIGDYRITGWVRNTGDKPAEYVQVTATLYDASGNVVAVDLTFLEADILVPGDTSSFKLTVFGSSGPADSYRLQVQGTEAD